MQDFMFKLYNKSMQRVSNHLFRGIKSTPPIQSKPNADTVLYCALNQPNYRAYILAVKSFLRFFPDIAVVVQDDGSLKQKAIDEISDHLPGISIFTIDEMFEGIKVNASEELMELLPGREAYFKHVPIRILYVKYFNVVLRILKRKKVIIIDSDLLFLRRPDEIIDWITKPYQYDFFGDGYNAEADRYRKLGFSFENLDIANFSSGTIGVGGEFSQDEITDILRRIKAQDPELFTKWEIEQALWAIILSKRLNPINLDRLREIYIGSGWRSYKELREKAVIAHFAGAIRFKNFRYQRLAREIITHLKSGPR